MQDSALTFITVLQESLENPAAYCVPLYKVLGKTEYTFYYNRLLRRAKVQKAVAALFSSFSG